MTRLSLTFRGTFAPVCLSLLLLTALPAAMAEEWIQLFNGKNLDGWSPKIRHHEFGENFGDTFRVEDGVIKVSYDKYGGEFKERFGHLFYKEPFSRYRLRAEYRFVGEQLPDGPGWATRNSGLMLHSPAPATMTLDQDFPVSIEVQLLGGDGENPRTTGNLCTPGTNVVMNGGLVTRHCISSSSKTYHGDQWVTIEVEMLGGESVKHYINGELVLEYEYPQLDPNDADGKRYIKDGVKTLEAGYISLQSESHPVEFRKVEILPLD